MSPNTLAPKPDPSAPPPPRKPSVQPNNRKMVPQTTQPTSFQFMPPRVPYAPTPMPSPRVATHVQNPLPAVVKANQPDNFLELIQGPTLTLLIGPVPSQHTYTLPSNLLTTHSVFFKNELARVLLQCISKKRKVCFSSVEDEDEDVRNSTPGGKETAIQTANGSNDNGVKKVDDENGVKKVDTEIDNAAKKVDTPPPIIKVEADAEPAAFTSSYTEWNGEFTSSAILKLPAIDPMIFGLFLKFIYQGTYPPGVDAGRVPNFQPPTLPVAQGMTSSANFMATAAAAMGNGSASRYSPYLPTSSASSVPGNVHTAPSLHAAARASTPTAAGHVTSTTPKTPIPRHLNASNPNLPNPATPQQIPPSISAYLLAIRLHAHRFTNHTLAHIYNGIGAYFVLTPSLIDYVWAQTKTHCHIASSNHSNPSSNLDSFSFAPSNTTPSNGPLPPTTTSTTHPAPTPGPIRNVSPLRRLLLDVLTLHWSSSSSKHIIAKSANLNGEWNRVFDKHDDLRRDFILGLQGGGGRVGVVEEYYVR